MLTLVKIFALQIWWTTTSLLSWYCIVFFDTPNIVGYFLCFHLKLILLFLCSQYSSSKFIWVLFQLRYLFVYFEFSSLTALHIITFKIDIVIFINQTKKLESLILLHLDIQAGLFLPIPNLDRFLCRIW